jgi:hypothetical protein
MSKIQNNGQPYNKQINNSSINNKEKLQKDMIGLVIEDNTIYEIDEDCYDKIKKSRLNKEII